MNFNFSEVLTRAWQITWKHKALWIYAMLPFILWGFYFPLFLFAFPWGSLKSPSSGFSSEPFIVVGAIVITLLTLIVQLFGNAALTLGTVRAEGGLEKQGFRELFKSSLPYVGRIFGAMVLIGVATLVFFFVFTACSTAVSIVTMGIGSIFLQFLLYPIMFAVWITMEVSQAAIVADEIGATNAIGRAWDLLTSYIWKFLLIGVVVYVAQAIVSSFVIMPILVPMWFVMYNSIVNETAPSTNILLVTMLCVVALQPLYAVVMGISTTFIRSTFVVTYQRLSRDSEARQEFLKAIASKESK
jgi:hypothetical protein